MLHTIAAVLLILALPIIGDALHPFLKIVMDGLVKISDQIRDYLNK